jgi:hypothetical protein
MSLESRGDTARPNLGPLGTLAIVEDTRPTFCPDLALYMAVCELRRALLEAAEELAEIRPIQLYAASWRRGRELGHRDRPRLAGAAAKLSFENPAETGSICEAEILGNSRD